MSETQLTTLLQIFDAGGNIALLGFMVLAFYRGDLIARVVLDRILAVYERQMAEMAARVDSMAYVRSLAGYRKNDYQPLDETDRRRVAREWARSFEVWGYPV